MTLSDFFCCHFLQSGGELWSLSGFMQSSLTASIYSAQLISHQELKAPLTETNLGRLAQTIPHCLSLSYYV